MTFLDKQQDKDKRKKEILDDTKSVHKFNHAGLECFICRYKNHWNGYVAVPKGHLLFNKYYMELDINVPYGMSYGENFNPLTQRKTKTKTFYGIDTLDRDECNDRNFTLKNTKSLAMQIASHKGYAVAVESGVGDDAIRVFHNRSGAGDDCTVVRYELPDTIERAVKTCDKNWRPSEADIVASGAGGRMARLPITIFEITQTNKRKNND